MTTGELGGELGDDPLAPELAGSALAISEILDVVDRVLAEPGRRSHVFGWLKRPGGRSHDWLPVDAYYPAHRLVVVSEVEAAPYRELFAELVPAHGLRLLELSPRELGASREAAMRTLRGRMAELGPPPDPASALAGGPRSRFRAWANTALKAPGRERPVLESSAVNVEPRAPAARGERQATGVFVGIALAAVLVTEIYVGVAAAGLDAGRVLLAFGLALDVCSRGLGTLAAGRAGSAEWAWWCALGGSPVVVSFALFQRGGPVETEPAPLAGLIGVLALVVLAVALVTGGV